MAREDYRNGPDGRVARGPQPGAIWGVMLTGERGPLESKQGSAEFEDAKAGNLHSADYREAHPSKTDQGQVSRMLK